MFRVQIRIQNQQANDNGSFLRKLANYYCTTTLSRHFSTWPAEKDPDGNCLDGKSLASKTKSATNVNAIRYRYSKVRSKLRKQNN